MIQPQRSISNEGADPIMIVPPASDPPLTATDTPSRLRMAAGGAAVTIKQTSTSPLQGEASARKTDGTANMAAHPLGVSAPAVASPKGLASLPPALPGALVLADIIPLPQRGQPIRQEVATTARSLRLALDQQPVQIRLWPQASPAPSPNATAGSSSGEAEVIEGQGVMMGHDAQGRAIIMTDDAALALRARIDLAPGRAVRFALLPAPSASASGVSIARLAFHPARGDDWSALRATLAALVAVDPALAQSFLGQSLPQPNRRLAASILFLLSTLRRGDASAWLGEDVVGRLRASPTGRIALEALSDDFKKTQQANEQARIDGGWQAAPLPFGMPDDWLRAQLFWRRHDPLLPKAGDEETDTAPKGRAQRFLIETCFSRLGPMQLDGLVQGRRFDLILRSVSGLPPVLRAGLHDIFRQGLDAVGYQGGLRFQHGAHLWAKAAIRQTEQQGCRV
jgi:hypothetical protein